MKDKSLKKKKNIAYYDKEDCKSYGERFVL